MRISHIFTIIETEELRGSYVYYYFSIFKLSLNSCGHFVAVSSVDAGNNGNAGIGVLGYFSGVFTCFSDIYTIYEPSTAQEKNGFIESFNGKLRDELLNGEIFETLKEAEVLVEMWRKEYNHRRPRSALGYKPPAPETTTPFPPAFTTLNPVERVLTLT